MITRSGIIQNGPFEVPLPTPENKEINEISTQPHTADGDLVRHLEIDVFISDLMYYQAPKFPEIVATENPAHPKIPPGQQT